MMVLVSADVRTWAFARRAEAYAANPPFGWTVQSRYNSDPPLRERWEGVLLLDTQASIANYSAHRPRVVRMISSHAWLHDKRTDDMRTRGVNLNRCRGRLKDLCAECDAVAVYNRAQAEAVSSVFGGRVVLAPYSVDTNVFTSPGHRQRDKLRIGWCQQVGGGMNCFKGLPDVLVPVIASVGDRAEWSVLTPDAQTALPTDELVKWYQSLHIFLCTSSGEGGPHGPFEAAACGAVVISTDVGQVHDWKVLGDLGLRVPTYKNAAEAKSVSEAMVTKIVHLHENRDYLRKAEMVQWGSIQTDYNAVTACPKQLEEMFRD